MVTGNHITCLLDYGDGVTEPFTSATYNALYAFTHTYTSIGPYDVRVACNNTLTNHVAVNIVNVAEALSGFTIPPYFVFEVDSSMVLDWSMTTGGYLFYTVEVGGISRSIGLYDVTHDLGVSVNAVGVYEGVGGSRERSVCLCQ